MSFLANLINRLLEGIHRAEDTIIGSFLILLSQTSYPPVGRRLCGSQHANCWEAA